MPIETISAFIHFEMEKSRMNTWPSSITTISLITVPTTAWGTAVSVVLNPLMRNSSFIMSLFS